MTEVNKQIIELKEIEFIMRRTIEAFFSYRFNLMKFINHHKRHLTKTEYLCLMRSTYDFMDTLNKIIMIKRENLRLLYELLNIKKYQPEYLPLLLFGLLFISLTNNK
ncbi:MAG: hypothetical protein GX490_01595 [Bacilli bacterium]|nr:hypothetical protein [Bacilli bacterium]